jgi:thiol:disulfide interchange protein DsbA
MIRYLFTALALLALSLPAGAQSPPPYVEINPPIATDDKGKIEVVEFFWYECPHCYSLEPALDTWVKKLPKDAEFKRVPAMFNERWAISARVYYTLEAIGELERLHRPLFEAIHKQSLRITNEKQLSDWLQRQNVDLAKFSAALKSFSVESRLKRAAELGHAAKLDGVPALMVNGRYLVSANATASEEKMLATADALIERSRKTVAASPEKKSNQ